MRSRHPYVIQALVALWLLPPTRAAAEAKALRVQVSEHVASLPASRVKAMLTQALTYLGVPYKWGGDDAANDGGFDCVGLAYAVYHASGLEFPFARYTSINMTPRPRGPNISKVWWTEYSPEFARTMLDCSKEREFKDGDVLVYHELVNGLITERTGHTVLVVDAKKAYAMSAAHSGVRLHALGDLHFFDTKTLTGCWRAASTAKPPLAKALVSWHVDLGPAAQRGTHLAPFRTSNPLDFVLTASAPGIAELRLDVTGRVLSLIGAVNPTVTELPTPPGGRQWRIHHDFKQSDLPVDPGEHIPTPQRKIVARLFDKAGLMVDEKVYYVEFHPYWN